MPSRTTPQAKIDTPLPDQDSSKCGVWPPSIQSDTKIKWSLVERDGAPTYLITVSFREQEIATYKLDKTASGNCHTFSLAEENSKFPATSGSVQVNYCNDSLQFSLGATLASNPAPLGAPTTLVTHTIPAPSDLFQPIPGNNPVRVDNATLRPYCYVGQLRMKFNTEQGVKSYIGTATVIAAPTDTGLYLLTCAHNLFDLVDGEATHVSFVPARNGQTTPATELIADKWFFPSEYKGVPLSHDCDLSTLNPEVLTLATQHDYAIVKLKTAVPDLPDGAPTLKAASNAELAEHANIRLSGLYGWESTQTQMFTTTGAITAKTADELRYNASTKPGASGTAIAWDKGDGSSIEVIGVHDGSGPQTNPKYNLGHRINSESLAKMNTWLTE